ncbi:MULTISPECIES: TetR/AcrR family transcriptional regulator [Clostridium]|uniref:TetR/AcrR family transcriptional regulator n=1 Tax=Clostridium cibarium TaxID=2762247 RepID=A0ABR8PXF2_9CLOT|nr:MULTISPECIES: TetR/AcrR family transcriptional regulator [Clostridium]MBD7912840.1 TetR/AcrR family transcriptional regulator [Clostridium cibarium]
MKNQGLTSRQLQAQKTKNKLYKISIELLEKQGYEKLKIEDICKKAGVSVGSFYNYFNSKNDILIEVYKRADNYFENEVKNNLTSTNNLDKIIEFFDYYGKYNDIVGIDIMKQLYNSSNKIFPQKGRLMQVLLKEIILEGQSKNEISSNMTPEEICDYLFISARGLIYDWCLHDGTYNIVEAMHKYISLLITIFKANN